MDLRPLFFKKAPLFWLGLAIRLALVAFAVPLIAATWFAPFIEGFIAAPTIDPWTAHLAASGDPLAFPYGPVMFLLLLPGVALGVALKALFGLAYAPIAGYALALLAVELACLALLARLRHDDATLACLWLSPAVILISYWHGQNDLVPVALLLLAILCLRGYHALWAGLALGLAIAAKLSMVLAAPIIAIYLYRNPRLRHLLRTFVAGVSGPLALQGLVFVVSPGARMMVLGTPEAAKVYQLALDLGGGLKIFILPVVYLLVLAWVWRLRRMSFDLLIAMLSIVFLLVVMLTPASPGWFIWVAPFLALHAAQTAPRGLLLIFGISLLQTISTFVQFSGASIPLLGLDATLPFAVSVGLNERTVSILVSIIFAFELVIVYRIWREGIQRNALYRLSQRPLVIGIAGDSGAGKDTLALALAGLFGEHAVASIGGDDYHRWDRARPMWNAVTHLNPRANDLERMTGDVHTLANGGVVTARQYDHATGRFTKPRRIDFNDVIIVSGLHALLAPSLHARYDVSIFLDMDANLRRYFKLRRDVGERGHAEGDVIRSIERRQPDAQRFIEPQRDKANIVFSLKTAEENGAPDHQSSDPVRFKLCVCLVRPLYSEELARALIATCGLHVDLAYLDGSQMVEMSIEGDVDAEDIAFVADILVPNLEELVALRPKWLPGMTGLMQLIVLTQASYAIRLPEARA